jgi:hypothetical protein
MAEVPGGWWMAEVPCRTDVATLLSVPALAPWPWLSNGCKSCMGLDLDGLDGQLDEDDGKHFAWRHFAWRRSSSSSWRPWCHV